MPSFPGSSAPTTDAASAVLKRVYLPGLQAQINTDTILMDKLKRVPQHQFRGEKVYLSARKGLGVTQTINAGNGDDLPPRTQQDYDALSFDVKEIAHRIAFSAIGLSRTKNAPEGAFIDILEGEMNGARDGIGLELNRQFMGDGSGDLASCTSALTGGSGMQVGSTRFLREGEPVVICSRSAGADAGGGADNTVLSISSGTLLILAATATCDSTDSLYHRRSTSTPIRNTDCFGLGCIVSTGNPGVANFGGVDRTANGKRYWQAHALHNSGTSRPLTTRLLKQGLNLQARSGRRTNANRMGICSDAVALEYGVTLVADKRYPAEFVTLDGGFDALNFAGIPIVWDKDAPEGRLYWLTVDDLMVAEMEPVQFEERDGSILFRVADKHQFEALLYTMTNLCGTRCNGHVATKDIREDNATHNL